jgi:DNA-binding winged helix-turn-helix (wHTH) protein
MVETTDSAHSPPTALDLHVLRLLVESQGKIIGRDFLARQTGLESASARRIDASLVAIRRWLGADSLVTVRRRGWMLTDNGHKAAETFMLQQVDTSQ